MKSSTSKKGLNVSLIFVDITHLIYMKDIFTVASTFELTVKAIYAMQISETKMSLVKPCFFLFAFFSSNHRLYYIYTKTIIQLMNVHQ